MKRRNILKAVGAGATIGLAGCTGENNSTTTDVAADEGTGDDSSEPAGDTPRDTATPSIEERIEVRQQAIATEKPACHEEGLLYKVERIYDDTQFVIKVEGWFKTEQTCAYTTFLDSKYDAEANNVTLRVGAGDGEGDREYDGECKTECESGVPTMRFAKSVEVYFNDVGQDDVDVDTFSVEYVYSDGNTTTVAEDVPLEVGETNTA